MAGSTASIASIASTASSTASTASSTASTAASTASTMVPTAPLAIMEQEPKRHKYICSNCNETGHNCRSCPYLLLIQKREYHCQYCGENGHPASKCPKFLTPLIPESNPCESLKRKPGQILTLAEKHMALHVLYKILQENTDNPFELASKYTGK
jgi:hypothetical protein